MICRYSGSDSPPCGKQILAKRFIKAAEPGASQSTLACCPFQLLPNEIQLSHCCAEKLLACAATASYCPLQRVPQLQVFWQ